VTAHTNDDERIRILIADDNTEFREGMRGLLAAQADLAVVGTAPDGDTALSLAARLLPDVVLMDLQMPGVNGIEATRRLVASSPHIGVLVVTMFEDDDSVFSAMRAGARGYLLKGARKAETLRAIRAVASGEAIFSPAIARRLMGFFAAPRPAPTAFPELTDREREILALIARGSSNQDIADQLSLSVKTVRNHVSLIYSKLQVADRAQAALRAREGGLN
jgi:DNA-binding NarL/FixJ family response regulator